MADSREPSRRTFILQSTLAGAAVLMGNPLSIFSQNKTQQLMNSNIKSKGYAGKNENGPLEFWEFERRPLGDTDILIDIKYSGICHSDIHTMKGHWGKKQYPLITGHEIAGIVTAIGKNVSKFKVGDQAGVGCMVNSCMQCESCKKDEENHCETTGMVGTYGDVESSSPSGIAQGGYSNNLVVTEHFAIKIPTTIE